MDGYMDGWIDGWMDTWMETWIHGWMDGYTVVVQLSHSTPLSQSVLVYVSMSTGTMMLSS